MSRSRVNCGEPCAIAAMPPITTKSTPASSSARSSAPRRSSGQPAKAPLRLERELSRARVLALEALEPLAGREPERLDDLRLVDARRHPRGVQDQRAVHDA